MSSGFSADDHEGISHVVLRGRLDTTGVGEIETRFTATVAPPARPAIVDLSAVEFESSMGLRLPIGTAHARSRRKANPVAFGAQPLVADRPEPRAGAPRRERMADALTDRLHLAIGGAGIAPGEALETFRTFLATAGQDPVSHHTATRAFEALVVDVLRHAGIRPDPGQAVVDVAAVVADDAVRFRIEDRGPPFDPTAHPEPPTPASIDEALIGGLGIQLVGRSVDCIDCARTDRGNRVDVMVLRQRGRAQRRIVEHEPRRVLYPGHTMPTAARVDPADLFTPQEWAALASKSRWRGLWLVAHCWGAIGACMVLGALWPWLIPLLVPLVAARQLGLLILMHDAAHGLLHPNRRVNDWVGRWLCSSALPEYRKAHLQHHRFTQQPEDPDLPLSRPFPIEAGSLRRKMLRDVTGASFLKLRLGIDLEARRRGRAAPGAKGTDLLGTGLDPRFVWGNLGFLAVFALAGHAWLWVALWLVPLAFWFPLVYRIRNIAEHALVPVGEPDPYRHARTTLASWWERALLAPYWVNHHGEHHLFTQLPCWSLPRAHALLAQRGALERMLVAPGYADVLRLAVKPRPVDAAA